MIEKLGKRFPTIFLARCDWPTHSVDHLDQRLGADGDFPLRDCSDGREVLDRRTTWSQRARVNSIRWRQSRQTREEQSGQRGW